MNDSFFGKNLFRFQSVFILLIFPYLLVAQSISGFIMNEENDGIPYANIYFNGLGTGTSTDENGKYFMSIQYEGEYEMIISSVGYATKTIKVFIREDDVTKNIYLIASNTEIDEIVVNASKKDPAYAIIKNAIDNKKKYLSQIQSFRSKVYIKASEVKEQKEKKKKKPKKEEPANQMSAEGMDTFDDKKEKEKLPQMNIHEVDLILNYQFPKKYKEERTAVKKIGNTRGLFIPRFDETDFNFYRNMVHLRGIAEAPVISPLSRTSILAYKFKLISTKMEDGQLVHKIKVTPHKSGNSTCKGFIYINDELWNINRLDLELNKDALTLFDKFRLKQDYTLLEDNVWIPNRIEFIYEAKQNKRTKFKGGTTIFYSDFEKDYAFPDKFFGTEIAVTTREAYKRDSIYWKNLRPEPLTPDQIKIISRADSIRAVHSSKAYRDSIQAKYNKVTLADLFWTGVGFRDHEKKRHIYFSSIPDLLDFELVGGLRIGPYISGFKRWESGRYLWMSSHMNIGFKNKDLQGGFSGNFFYNPHRLSSVDFAIGRSFYSINPFDAYLNQLRTSNYILHDRISVGHRFEIVNGLYLNTNFHYTDRQSLEGYDTETLIDSIFNDDTTPLEFEDYQGFITNFSLSYTPQQKYMTEPDRKVILGSKFPTFRVNYRKGWNKLFGSDIEFDYVQFSIDHDLILGVFGNSKYNVKIGKYINTKDLRIVDLKRFRQSDPFLFSEPLNSFQLLDTAFATTNLFFEFHHLHHFNGALVNNIPLVKLTKVRVVAGGGMLWVQDNNFRHQELVAGLERVFRLGARRRLKVGVYGVLAKSRGSKTDTGFKIAFDVIDTWDQNWNF